MFGWDAIYAALSPSNPIPTVIHAASVAALSGALAALLFGNASFWVTLFTVGAAEFAFVFGLEPLWGGRALPKQETQRVLSPINVRNISLY